MYLKGKLSGTIIPAPPGWRIYSFTTKDEQFSIENKSILKNRQYDEVIAFSISERGYVRYINPSWGVIVLEGEDDISGDDTFDDFNFVIVSPNGMAYSYFEDCDVKEYL